jgi:hypothetical protein
VLPAGHEENYRKNAALLAFLDRADQEYFEDVGELDPETAIAKRRAVRQQLLRACPGDWSSDGDILYYSDYSVGCTCNTDEEACEFIFGLIDKISLNVRPCIPVLNRWNKLYGPMAWWSFAVGFYGLVSSAVIRAKDDIGQLSDPTSLAHDLAEAVDVGGPEGETTFRVIKAIRFHVHRSKQFRQVTYCSGGYTLGPEPSDFRYRID